jgi:hypothetical protein
MPPPMQRVARRGFDVAALQLVQHRAEDHRAGRAEGMAHSNGAAVDVHLVVRHVEKPACNNMTTDANASFNS